MKREKGFTLLEVLIAASIMLVIGVAVANFASESLWMYRGTFQRMNSELEGRQALRTMVKELRAAEAVYSVSTTSLSFAADLNNDGVSENLSYLLEEGDLIREFDGDRSLLASGVLNEADVPIFSRDERYVSIKLILNGKEHSSGVTLRNE